MVFRSLAFSFPDYDSVNQRIRVDQTKDVGGCVVVEEEWDDFERKKLRRFGDLLEYRHARHRGCVIVLEED